MPTTEKDFIQCKITDKNGSTKNDTLWGENITHKATGSSTLSLCSEGWIHYYRHPLLAAFMYPSHVNFKAPILWEVKCEGKQKHDNQLKSGCRKLTTLRQIELPEITTEQRVEIAIRCVLAVFKNQSWISWANKWLAGEDRTKAAAITAADAAIAAATAEHTVAYITAATAANYAATAAAYAANYAANYAVADYAAAANYTAADYAAAVADYAAAAADYAVAATAYADLLNIIKKVLKLT